MWVNIHVAALCLCWGAKTVRMCVTTTVRDTATGRYRGWEVPDRPVVSSAALSCATRLHCGALGLTQQLPFADTTAANVQMQRLQQRKGFCSGSKSDPAPAAGRRSWLLQLIQLNMPSDLTLVPVCARATRPQTHSGLSPGKVVASPLLLLLLGPVPHLHHS